MPGGNEEDEQDVYSWEAAYAEGLNIRQVLAEDESGSVQKSVANLLLDAKKKRRAVSRPTKVRLGILRYMYIVIDCSQAMSDKSLSPSRISVTVSMLCHFLEKFFEQNPISQIGVIVCREKRAERLIPLTGDFRRLREALQTLNELSCLGEFSLQNSLQLAMTHIQDYPGHAAREVLVIMASLSTCDASNIFATFELLQRHNIRCSVIGLAAELYVCKKLCVQTGGSYHVILDKSHMEIVLAEHTHPPIAKKASECNVVRIGFPVHEIASYPVFCICHAGNRAKSQAGEKLFSCPQCGGRYCSVPVECRICRLTLVTAPQLARASQHLIPLDAFVETECADSIGMGCFGCQRAIGEKSFNCKLCNAVFCIDCDLLLHESVQICPSCPD